MFRQAIFLLVLTVALGAFFSVKEVAFAPVEIRKPAADLRWLEVYPAALGASTTAPWPVRDAAAAFVWLDKIWLLGGVNGEGALAGQVKYWELPHYNDIWSSFDGLVWNQAAAAAAWPPRRSMSVAAWGDKLLMLGGWSPIGGYRSDIWISADAINWTVATSAAAWPPREGQTLTVFQNKLWLMGGVNFDKRLSYNDVWSSLDGLNWTLAASSTPWSGRYDHAVEVFDNRLWLIGGLVPGGVGQSDIWSSADGTSWTLETNQAFWGKRHGHALLNWLGRLWLVSGWDTDANQGVSDIWSSSDGKNWIKTPSSPPWRGREDHAALIFRGDLWLFGGMDADWRWRNDVWRAR